MAVEAPGTPPAVTGAIRHASRVTGTNFQYLVATAQVESRFNPSAAAPTSTARGLFQFVEQTWLATLKEQGPALGYGELAGAIERAPGGHYFVTDPRQTNRIMNLRRDPTANAVMAGAYTRTNAGKLVERLGRAPSEGELYIAHFLGSAGAGRLISLAESNPGVRASDAFPSAARANPSIFYGRGGKARSVGDVYRALVNRYAAARADQVPVPVQQQLAGTSVPVPQPKPATQHAQPLFAPDSAALTESYAAAARMSDPSQQIPDMAPVFHGLFRTSPGREAVAPVVSALWSAPKPEVLPEPHEADVQQVSASPERPQGRPIGLFQDRPADARALFRGRV